MTINIALETLVSFSNARSSFPDGRRKSLATLHRWRLHGVRGVRLETLLIGGVRYTSLEAIDRFIHAQNADDAPAAPMMTSSQRRKQSEDALTALEEMGVSRGITPPQSLYGSVGCSVAKGVAADSAAPGGSAEYPPNTTERPARRESKHRTCNLRSRSAAADHHD